MKRTAKIVVGVALAVMTAFPIAPASAGPVECINEKFWGGRFVECPGDTMDCVNAYFWHGQIGRCL